MGSLSFDELNENSINFFEHPILLNILILKLTKSSCTILALFPNITLIKFLLV